MTSEKQIAANRANAEKSTGPKTPETKAISSMNALRHGLTGQVNLMPDEDRVAHDKFCAAIVESLAPEGALEIQFAQAIAEDNWRMNRGRAIETNIFAIGSFGPGFPGNPDTMTFGTATLDINNPVVRPYPRDIEAQGFTTGQDMQKSLDRLTALQTERKARRQDDLDELAALLEASEIKHQPIENTETTGTNGFVFSIHQIHARVIRKRQLKQAEATIHRTHKHQNPHHQNKQIGAARSLGRAA
jgi:hypothetical protein